MKSEGESSLSGTLKQKQSAVETHTAAVGEDNTHTHTFQQGKHFRGEELNKQDLRSSDRNERRGEELFLSNMNPPSVANLSHKLITSSETQNLYIKKPELYFYFVEI